MARLHGVAVPPRPGLPRGLHLFSVYAPLQDDAQRTVFNSELVPSLDMQVPMIFLGDFNGSVFPERDYSSGVGPVCPLLSRVLDPGGPLLDLQLVVSPDAFDFTFRRAHLESTSHSRFDLALGNRAVLGLVSRVFVEPGLMDGGHSPVIVELRDHSAWTMCWKRPRRQLPALLSSCAPSEDFTSLLEVWGCSPEVQRFLHPQPGESVQTLSTLMDVALQHLVTLAGGWESRSSCHRAAYESAASRKLRRILLSLGRCSSMLRRAALPGPLPYPLVCELRHLEDLGLTAPTTPFREDLVRWVEAELLGQRQVLAQEVRTMRAVRIRR